MTARLTVQNAEIKTAAVEIQTLTISGKQVTLAVFRQLYELELIAEDGTLNGVPWGDVNYHPDRCGEADPHWHIVWQRGSDLLRAYVTVTPRPWDYCKRYWDMPSSDRVAIHKGRDFSALTAEENEARHQQIQAREVLRDLPQLFIAV